MKKPKKAASSAAGSERRSRGQRRGDVLFPVPPGHDSLPESYPDVLGEIKHRIQTERLRVTMAANSAMVILYWDIGRLILDRQEREGWGAKVIDRLSADLRDTYPEMRGLSPRNLLFMRSFATVYPEPKIVKQLVSQLPWGHIIRLLQRIKAPDVRHWYVKASIEHGWSRNILSTYDDLIENNWRRMVFLEEAARRLYREWFVRLRFPGHEHSRITNGVPEGWEKGHVGDFYDTASGGTPSRKNPEYFTGEIPWVRTQIGKLRAARDLLLPRLMSGETAV